MLATAKFSYEPKVPSSLATKPPPHEIIPTFIQLNPIKVTTTPETKGVIIFFV